MFAISRSTTRARATITSMISRSLIISIRWWSGVWWSTTGARWWWGGWWVSKSRCYPLLWISTISPFNDFICYFAFIPIINISSSFM